MIALLLINMAMTYIIHYYKVVLYDVQHHFIFYIDYN
jgi:hypothetical protein